MASDFHEVRFPLDVGLGGRGGPVRRTDIVTLASGREHRNSRWAGSRRVSQAAAASAMRSGRAAVTGPPAPAQPYRAGRSASSQNRNATVAVVVS